MAGKAKTRICKRRTCRAEYEPKTEWQKFCSDKCRDAVGNEKKGKILRDYRRQQRLIEAQESKSA